MKWFIFPFSCIGAFSMCVVVVFQLGFFFQLRVKCICANRNEVNFCCCFSVAFFIKSYSESSIFALHSPCFFLLAPACVHGPILYYHGIAALYAVCLLFANGIAHKQYHSICFRICFEEVCWKILLDRQKKTCRKSAENVRQTNSRL